MNKVIAFAGCARAGKDTACKLLQERFPDLNIQRAAFADWLKSDLRECEQALRKYAHYDPEVCWDHKEMFRSLWVEWSRVAKRFDKMFWVKRLEPVIDKLRERGWVCITDVRYVHEVKYLKERYNAHVFYISRPRYLAANAEEEMSFWELQLDCSELFQGWNYVYNDGSLEDLGNVLETRIKEIV